MLTAFSALSVLGAVLVLFSVGFTGSNAAGVTGWAALLGATPAVVEIVMMYLPASQRHFA